MKLRLKEVLSDKGMRQAAVAEKAEITPGYMSLLVNGERSPSPDLVTRLATVLGVPVSELMEAPPQPGFAEEATAFAPTGPKETTIADLFKTKSKRVELYRMKKAAATLALLPDDILGVDRARPAKPGETVLVSQWHDDGSANTFTAIWAQSVLVPGDPVMPPVKYDEEDQSIGILGPVVGMVRI